MKTTAVRAQMRLDLFGQEQEHDPDAYPWAGGLVFDYFAGGGGASTGLAAGLGRSPDFAINHNKLALAMHEQNHPETVHIQEDVWTVDPRALAKGRPVLLLWGSPDCRHFSSAKRGKPVKKAVRGLAWVLHRFAGKVLPAVLMMENVPEFATWGPLVAVRDGTLVDGRWIKTRRGKPVHGPDGRPVLATGRVVKLDGTVAAPGERVPVEQQQLQPDPARRGETFRHFVETLENKGYVVEWRELRACDYGAPTSRKRLFLVARRDGLPIVWPTPTHGDPRSHDVKDGRILPWRTAGEVIDWSTPAPSIFERDRPLQPATCARIARGIMRYVVEAGDDAFVVSLDHQGAGPNASATAEAPLSTITGKARHCVVVPTLVQTGFGERPGQAPRVPGLNKPLGTVVAGGAKHGLVSAFLAKNYGGVVGIPATVPTGTITAKDHHSLVAASLVRLKGSCRDGQSLDTPLGSIQAQGTHYAAVAAFLQRHEAHATPDVTINGESYTIVDIGFRMLQPAELFAAQGFPADYEHELVTVGGVETELTKAQQIAACGNSVPPAVVEALVRANVPQYAHRAAKGG